MTYSSSNHIAVTQRIRCVIFSFLLIIVLLLQQGGNIFEVTVVAAFPSGAGGCDGGRAASRGFHFNYGNDSSTGRIRVEGNLEFFNTTLTINDEVMSTNNDNITVYDGGRDIIWSLTAGPDLPMRGVLFRVEPNDPNAEFTLTGDENLQPSEKCEKVAGNVEGMTHRSRAKKQYVSGSMRFDNDGIVDIDVTVVYMNGRAAPENLSIFTYFGFQLEIQNSPPFVPVPVPVTPPPTTSPVQDRCMTNTCSAFLGIGGRLYNRFRDGQCRQRCTVFGFFVSSSSGWRCGKCF